MPTQSYATVKSLVKKPNSYHKVSFTDFFSVLELNYFITIATKTVVSESEMTVIESNYYESIKDNFLSICV